MNHHVLYHLILYFDVLFLLVIVIVIYFLVINELVGYLNDLFWNLLIRFRDYVIFVRDIIRNLRYGFIRLVRYLFLLVHCFIGFKGFSMIVLLNLDVVALYLQSFCKVIK